LLRANQDSLSPAVLKSRRLESHRFTIGLLLRVPSLATPSRALPASVAPTTPFGIVERVPGIFTGSAVNWRDVSLAFRAKWIFIKPICDSLPYFPQIFRDAGKTRSALI
jgi:hypothetical protein